MLPYFHVYNLSQINYQNFSFLMERTGQTQTNDFRTIGQKDKTYHQMPKTGYLKCKKPQNKIKKNKNLREDLPSRKPIKAHSQKTQLTQQTKRLFEENKKQRTTHPALSPVNAKNNSFKVKLAQSFDNQNQYHLNMSKTPKKVKPKIKTLQTQRKLCSSPFLSQQKKEIKQQNCANLLLNIKKRSSYRKIDLRKNKSYENNKSLPQSPKLRYAKFQFRTQKYSKIAQELKASERPQLKEEKTLIQKTIRPRSDYRTKVTSLEKKIQDYRSLSSRSQTALKKLQCIKRREEKQFKKKIKNYLEEIKKLEAQLQEYRPNIGHLYSYKEYTNQKLVPEEVIMEECEESRFKPLESTAESRQKGLTLMQYYLTQNLDKDVSSSASELCLSITSNDPSQ